MQFYLRHKSAGARVLPRQACCCRCRVFCALCACRMCASRICGSTLFARPNACFAVVRFCDSGVVCFFRQCSFVNSASIGLRNVSFSTARSKKKQLRVLKKPDVGFRMSGISHLENPRIGCRNSGIYGFFGRAIFLSPLCPPTIRPGPPPPYAPRGPRRPGEPRSPGLGPF